MKIIIYSVKISSPIGTISNSEVVDSAIIVKLGKYKIICRHDSTYRPLSRRLDRCDRVIHNESGDPNGGNMCSFSGETCTSRVHRNADYVPYAKIRFDL